MALFDDGNAPSATQLRMRRRTPGLGIGPSGGGGMSAGGIGQRNLGTPPPMQRQGQMMGSPGNVGGPREMSRGIGPFGYGFFNPGFQAPQTGGSIGGPSMQRFRPEAQERPGPEVPRVRPTRQQFEQGPEPGPAEAPGKEIPSYTDLSQQPRRTIDVSRPSQRSDLYANNMREVIRRGYREALGRDPGDYEIDSQLRAQGWNPGDRFVGQKGAQAILGSLGESEEGRKYKETGKSQIQREREERGEPEPEPEESREEEEPEDRRERRRRRGGIGPRYMPDEGYIP